jgi:hypothetical protein
MTQYSQNKLPSVTPLAMSNQDQVQRAQLSASHNPWEVVKLHLIRRGAIYRSAVLQLYKQDAPADDQEVPVLLQKQSGRDNQVDHVQSGSW